jgi:hypothetical protein
VELHVEASMIGRIAAERLLGFLESETQSIAKVPGYRVSVFY